MTPIENPEIQYTVQMRFGSHKDKIINRVFKLSEIENDGIAAWLTNHGYFFSVEGDINKYIDILHREII